MSYTSPFGKKYEIKITKKHYEKYKDTKYKDFVYDPERGCDQNEYEVLLINSEGEYMTVKSSKD